MQDSRLKVQEQEQRHRSATWPLLYKLKTGRFCRYPDTA